VSAPKLSVVIATFNRPLSLRRLLAQLGDQTLSAADYEVIVVDDGSAEELPAELRHASAPFASLILL